MKRAWLRAAIVPVALLLSACATQSPVSSPTPEPPSPTPSVTTASETALTGNGDVPQVLDPDLLEHLPVTVHSQSGYERHIFASWPEFDKPKIDAAIRDYYQSTIKQFEQDYPQPADPEAPSPELNLDWHLLAASPSMIGIVADGYQFAGADAIDLWHTMWFDPSSDTVYQPADLVNSYAVSRALIGLEPSRRTTVTTLDLSPLGSNPYGAATLVAFTGNGDLIVGFDECQVAACVEDRVTMTIPATTVAPMLTAAGKRAQAAEMDPVDPTTTASASAASPSPVPVVTPQPTAKKVNCKKLKCVAITFDDGPGPYTKQLLGYLKAGNVPATFFMLGQQVDTYPSTARAVAKAGHEIGVHTWSHRDLTRLSPIQIDKEITSTVDIIRNETGVTPTLLRPPYGAVNASVRKEARKAGLAVILWNVDTLDWKTRSTPKTVKAALRDTRRGSIILLHDIHKTSVAAVPDIIAGLQAKGYTFVTVTDLLGDPQPGVMYRYGR